MSRGTTSAAAIASTRIYRGDSWNRDERFTARRTGPRHSRRRRASSQSAENGSRASSPGSLARQRRRQATSRSPCASAKTKSAPCSSKRLRSETRCAIARGSKPIAATCTSKPSGRVGYMHIPDMGPWGFAEFHRGYLSEFDREGLIVDVRYNRGGHVSPLLLEKLATQTRRLRRSALRYADSLSARIGRAAR